MNLSNLTSAHFKQIISLLDKKEALQTQIAELEQQVGDLLNGVGVGAESASGQTTRRAKNAEPRPEISRSREGAKRGELKESIIAELKNAGEAGVSVKELADKLEVKSANLHAWFGSTGKKLAGLNKIGPAKYSLATESAVQ